MRSPKVRHRTLHCRQYDRVNAEKWLRAHFPTPGKRLSMTVATTLEASDETAPCGLCLFFVFLVEEKPDAKAFPVQVLSSHLWGKPGENTASVILYAKKKKVCTKALRFKPGLAFQAELHLVVAFFLWGALCARAASPGGANPSTSGCHLRAVGRADDHLTLIGVRNCSGEDGLPRVIAGCSMVLK